MKEIDEVKDLKLQQEKHRKELAENRAKIKERKARTQRLIRRGAIAEGFVGEAEKMSDNEFYNALKKLCNMKSD